MILVAAILIAQTVSPPATYRLRGDALVMAGSPSGILAISGDGRASRAVSAEALIWAGAGGAEFDALVASVTVRHPRGFGEARAGRMILTAGALMPVHLDGIVVTGRAPFGTTAEFFAGIPVVPRFGYRGGDWLVGGRVAQRIADFGAVGIAIEQRVDEGTASAQTVGLDASLVPIDSVDVSVRAAYDLLNPGVSEAMLGGGTTLGPVRLSVLAQHRSPSRILPATSIFSVLGDVPSNVVRLTADWRVAPRLSVSGSAGARHVEQWGEDISVAATLRLDDRGAGAVGTTLTRSDVRDAGWMGARVWIRVPVVTTVVVAFEGELARTSNGDVWPWTITSVRWAIAERWDTAVALEVSASPSFEYASVFIARVSYRWGVE